MQAVKCTEELQVPCKRTDLNRDVDVFAAIIEDAA